MTAAEIVKIIQDASDKFGASASASQKAMWKEVELLLKDLDIKDGKVTQSVKNLRAIGAIRRKIEKAVLNPQYMKSVDKYLEAFGDVADAQKLYFSDITDQNLPDKVLGIIKDNSIATTIQYLTEAGISTNVTQGIQNILKANITGGGSFSDLSSQMRDFILTNDKGLGALERYTKQITTDAINQYNGQYMQAVTASLGLKWYMYVGSNLTTTREFCSKLTKKKYFHIKELPDIISGQIDGEQCALDKRTELPKGMIDGTNVSNFEVYRGGYNCGHQSTPVAESFVPKKIRIETYMRLGIPYDKDGFAMA